MVVSIASDGSHFTELSRINKLFTEFPDYYTEGPGFFFDSLLGQALRTDLRSLTLCRVIMCLFLKMLKKYCVLIMQEIKEKNP